MFARTWITRLFGRITPRTACRRGTARREGSRARLALEGLEGRLAPATLVVNSTQDTANQTDPYLSLREALAIVNSPSLPSGLSDQILARIDGTLHDGGTDSIGFDSTAVTGPIVLGGTQLELSLPASMAAVTINGGSGVTVDAAGLSRVFLVDSGVQATLANLTITHGNATGAFPDGNGGGIYNSGTLTVTNSTLRANSARVLGGGIEDLGPLTVTNSTLSSNSASIGIGGGINIDSGTVTVTNSTISSNFAAGDGGGIENGGTLTVTNSTLSANSTSSGGGFGGGIDNSGTVTVSNSTLSANSGGGISVRFGTVTVTNSTLSANSTSGTGGGILNEGTLTVSNSTISFNSAASGGGIGNLLNSVSLQNTIVAGNSSSTNNGPDISGTLQSTSSNNLVGIGDSNLSGISNGPNGNLIGSSVSPIDARLGPLADNGGPTLTEALLPDSPARGAGSLSFATATDQRGLPRTVGGEIDVGAFQTQTAVAGPQVVVSNPSGVVDTPVDHVRLTFNHPMDPTSLTADQLSLSGPDGSIDLTGITVVASTNNQQFEVSFASQSQPGDYALVVGTEVQDVYGNSPSSPSTGQFIFPGLSGCVLTVNSTADTASDSDPFLTLREAIALVNRPTLPNDLSPEIVGQISGTLHAHGSDSIVFDHTLVTAPITLGGSQLELSAPRGRTRITIDGGSGVTLDGNNASRVLEVRSGVQATLANLTITHGKVTGDSGGAIATEGTLTVSSSTLTSNSAYSGGGIYNLYGTLTVTNSTISSNSASGLLSSGGGILNFGTVIVSNSTISYNSVHSSAVFSSGGGIDTHSGSSLSLQNTIVAGNSISPNTAGPDISGAVVSTSSYNLIGIGDGLSGISNGVNGNQIGTPSSPIDPLLAPLGDYGGPTPTMPLLAGSPALDAGDPTQSGSPDQRGLPRTGAVNIGAFQASAASVVLSAPDSAQPGVPFDLGVAVYDAFGQLAVGYTGTVHFSSTDSDPNVVLPPDYAFGLSDGGTVTFSAGVTLVSPGEQTLTATDLESGITGSTVVTL
jgi:hypothetical protein